MDSCLVPLVGLLGTFGVSLGTSRTDPQLVGPTFHPDGTPSLLHQPDTQMTLTQAQSCIRAKGRKELIKHLEGGKLTMRQRLLAKCFECMGGYADGTQDCRIHLCPVYPVMPYRENKL